jgi:dTDP-4-amino-4,6-dideoxygalactose transaminase
MEIKLTTVTSHDLILAKKSIEKDAKNFTKINEKLRNNFDFIKWCIINNAWVHNYLTTEEKNNTEIALVIAELDNSSQSDKKRIPIEKFYDDDFYFKYIKLKIKNQSLTNFGTLIREDYFSSKENVNKLLNECGVYNSKVISEELRDDEYVMVRFCKNSDQNANWCSARILKLSLEAGLNPHKYMESKILHDKIQSSIIEKPIEKKNKNKI